MIKRELTYFCTAIMFFTRIPIPFHLPYNNEIMNKSQKYFPLVGLVVGLLAALAYYISQLVFPNDISIILSVCLTVLLTGAFHEDGFTDSCDAFGGGYGKENIMTIMKDSRIGAYGVIGILLLLILKIVTLVHLSHLSLSLVIFAIICGHTTSRFHAGMTIYTHQYVQDIDKSKSKPLASKKLPWNNILLSLIITLLPYLLYQNWLLLLAFPISYLGKIYLSYYFKKHIGGYTGDCLGAIQQICEVIFYLSILGLCKYM
ncbi:MULTISPECIES: adenosylcobinamide-GDP ribazoletransferase [Myroides]|uniref:Adenosylcobinamide-GDP ribazoletransferase n=1 Tax=Myroides albus TaxID=2562892 RepID=A0A6I3LE59_9FLAO|nr:MULTISPECIES: adenosylcobinamide-GDP ribazoletransferase [Myroides]MTG97739.1 adenosylcobinamide-GDP ribazoletransferase [Myroides albus]MVX34909.1 adenosylcobinamide-GDP ribazoletransferase [Myroides sp. LoEW2-1]UVD78712.1 adenosylcobinamide-GDP ribazoletransferase [Myroides albus]